MMIDDGDDDDILNINKVNRRGKLLPDNAYSNGPRKY